MMKNCGTRAKTNGEISRSDAIGKICFAMGDMLTET